MAVEAVDGDELVRLRRETTVIKVPSYMAAWPRDGISLPGLVAVSDQRVLSGEDTLLWHEMIHQHQYRRDGSARFMVRYVVDWHRGLVRGCRFVAAYESIGYELETEALLRQLRVDLGGVHSEDFERIASMLEDPSLRLPQVKPRLYGKPVTALPRESFERPAPNGFPVPTSTPTSSPTILPEDVPPGTSSGQPAFDDPSLRPPSD